MWYGIEEDMIDYVVSSIDSFLINALTILKIPLTGFLMNIKKNNYLKK